MNDSFENGAEYALLKEIVSLMPAGILVIDTDTTVVKMINNAGARILGIPADTLLEQKCPDMLASCFEKHTGECERTLERPDGTEVTVLRSSRVLSYGNKTYRLESFVDISRQKQLERQTKEEMERALKRSEEYAKKADEASRSKSSFLASMSHEIRTPINGVLGFLSLLKDTEVSREQMDYLQNAENSARILLALISDILDFSKIEAGKLDIEKISFNLHDAVEETVITFTPKAEENKIGLFIFISPEVPVLVKGDPHRFKQILMNLCSNAVKFTSRGNIEVRVSAPELKDKKVLIRVDVIDEGIGLSSEKTNAIFSPFSQADPSVAREFGGSGLGLTISKQLVQMLKGSISVESTEGRGSTFSFSINFDRIQEQPSAGKEDVLRDLPVLLLSAKERPRRILEAYCGELGTRIDVYPVTGGPLPDISGGRFLCVLVDSATDSGPDLELLRFLCKNKTPETGLIVLAYPGESAAVRCFEEVPGVVVVSKPLRKQVLRNTLLRINGSGAAACAGEEGAENPLGNAADGEKGKLKKSVTVLIAEDNVINQKLACKILEKHGYSFDVAADGRQALDLYRCNSYDLILMDCLMPEMDGYVSTLKIRQSEKKTGARRTPIIALTANVMKGERQKVLSAGMDDYLSKPVEPQKMIETIEKWLKKGKDR